MSPGSQIFCITCESGCPRPLDRDMHCSTYFHYVTSIIPMLSDNNGELPPVILTSVMATWRNYVSPNAPYIVG